MMVYLIEMDAEYDGKVFSTEEAAELYCANKNETDPCGRLFSYTEVLVDD